MSYLIVIVIIKLGYFFPKRFEVVLIKMLAFFLKNVLRYRKSTISNNLKNSFPTFSKAEINQLLTKNYSVLSKYFIESFLAMAKGVSYYEEKVKFKDLNTLTPYLNQQKPLIILGTHYGNWELIMPLFARQFDVPVFGIYKPISNKRIDQFMRNKRSEIGLKLIPMKDTLKIMKEYRNQASIFILISDQSPANMNNVIWTPFFNQNTPCMNGVVKLSTIFKASVFYLKTSIEGRYYDNSIVNISTEYPDEIIPIYMQMLEENIRQNPAYWLWSHKRWKRAHLFSKDN
jgi:KDO2-lipid IV(A) lauroyltransferase